MGADVGNRRNLFSYFLRHRAGSVARCRVCGPVALLVAPPARSVAHGDQKAGWGGAADDRLHHAGMLLPGPVAFQPGRSGAESQHGHQVGAGRIAVGTDALRIKVVLVGVRAQPADGALDVLYARGDGRLGVDQAVIDANADVSLAGELHGRADEVAGSLVAAAPAAAVDEDDRRAGAVAALAGHGQVQLPGIVTFTIGDVGHYSHALGGPFEQLFVRCAPGVARSVGPPATKQASREGLEFRTIEKSVFVGVVTVEAGLESALSLILSDFPVAVLVHRQPASHEFLRGGPRIAVSGVVAGPVGRLLGWHFDRGFSLEQSQ